MNLAEILEQHKAFDTGGLLAALAEIEQISINAGEEVKKASCAYYDNADLKAAAIKGRIAMLNKRRDEYQKEIDALKKPLVSATVDGDKAELDRIKARMKELEADKAQAMTEIEMLQSAYVTGDAELYEAIMAKNDHYQETLSLYRAARELVHELAREKEEAFKTIREETGGLYHGRYVQDFEKLYGHYHAEERAKADAAWTEKEAERKAAKEKEPRDLRTNVYKVAGHLESLHDDELDEAPQVADGNVRVRDALTRVLR